jgi:hypothetical protein
VEWDDAGVTDSDVEELRALVSGATPYAEFDFIVCVLLRFLRTRATRSARLQFLAEYRSARRERFSIPTVFLRTLCPDLAVSLEDGAAPSQTSVVTSEATSGRCVQGNPGSLLEALVQIGPNIG